MQNNSVTKVTILESIQLFKDAFPLTARVYVRFLKDNVGLIAGFALGSQILEEFFNYQDKMTSGITSVNMMVKFGLAITSLLMSVFYSVLIPMRIEEYDTGLPRRNLWSFVADTAAPYTLENLRAFAKCLLWLVGGAVGAMILAFIFVAIGYLDRTLLEKGFEGSLQSALETGLFLHFLLPVILVSAVFIGPALFYYLRYTFVSYVVLVDPEYKSGKVDALRKSFDLARGVTWIIVILFAFMTLFEVIRAKLGENNGFMTAPLTAIVILIAFELVGLFLNILLFRVYELRVRSANGVSD